MKFGSGRALAGKRAFRAARDAWEDLFASPEYRASRRADRFDTDQLPVLTPVTWRLYQQDCGCGRAGECPWCAWAVVCRQYDGNTYDNRMAPRIAAGERPRWHSADAALQEYWATICDGYPAGSVSGSIVAFGKLGCWTQRGERASSASEYAADGVVSVERALRYAIPGDGWRRDAALLIARRGLRVPVDLEELAAAFGLRATEVVSAVRRGMRGLRVDLAARGLIQHPALSSRDYEQMAARREELLGRREQ